VLVAATRDLERRGERDPEQRQDRDRTPDRVGHAERTAEQRDQRRIQRRVEIRDEVDRGRYVDALTSRALRVAQHPAFHPLEVAWIRAPADRGDEQADS
jgi:hypothetical protein